MRFLNVADMILWKDRTYLLLLMVRQQQSFELSGGLPA